MSIISTIFGGKGVIEAGFDLIDNLHTSDTELIEAKTKAKVDMLNAYSGFKVAQRVLAFMFVTVYLVSFSFSMYFGLTDSSLQGEVVANMLEQYHIGWITLTIVGFYFGGGAFEGLLNAKKK